jgi:hypothetical protein
MSMRLACYNLHFAGGTLRQRALRTVGALRALPAPCLVLLQEACATTAAVVAHELRATHAAHFTDGPRPFLLTLVPIGSRASVRTVRFPPGLTETGRHAHLVRAGALRVAHVHLESCARSRGLRDAQYRWLRAELRPDVVAGDLNGLAGWHRRLLAREPWAERCARLPGVSPHPLCVYDPPEHERHEVRRQAGGERARRGAVHGEALRDARPQPA